MSDETESARVWKEAVSEPWAKADRRALFQKVAATVAHDLTPNEHFPTLYKDAMTQCAHNGFEWGWNAALKAAGLLPESAPTLPKYNPINGG